MTGDRPIPVPRGAAVYLAVVQFVFVTCWTVYVIYLPGLLDAAGVSRRFVIYVLMLDQAIFAGMDVVMGVAADRAGRALGRMGPLILGATALSCVAFLLIPHAARWGAYAPAASLAVLLVWTATSSALRAPPWAMLGKYAAAPEAPWMNAMLLTGLAIAGAIAPYLGIALKNVDARLPFAVSSVALLVTTAGLVRVERLLARQTAVVSPPVPVAGVLSAGARRFLLGALVLALGFQIHFSLNSPGQYSRLAGPQALQYLAPVFWIGFNLAMFPGATLAKRHGALKVMGTSALVGAAGALASGLVASLAALVAAQLVAGGAWGCMLMAGFAVALEFGRTGREGFALGLLFSVLALATFARMAAAAADVGSLPGFAQALSFAPFVLWCGGAAALLALARRVAPRGARRPGS